MATIQETIKTQIYIVDQITASIPAQVQNRFVYAKNTGLLYTYTGSAENFGWSVALSGIDAAIDLKQNINVSVEGLSSTTVEGSLAELAAGVSQNAGDITALKGRMDTAEGDIDALESGKVDKTTTVNSKALSGNITLGADDIDVSAAIGDIAAQGDSVEKVLGAVNTALGTKLTAASNLSDVADVATARTNLDVYSKSETVTQISTAITNVTSTEIPAEGAVDTKLASEKAVADAVASVKASLAAALEYKGTKDTYEELPVEGNNVGDVWNVVAAHGTTPAGTNYAWDGTKWDALGGSVDLSPYQTSAITVGEESTTVVAAITANKNAIDTHVANTENPHNVTKAQVGLGNVDNTSDADKPISTATQAALDGKASLSGDNNFTGSNSFTKTVSFDSSATFANGFTVNSGTAYFGMLNAIDCDNGGISTPRIKLSESMGDEHGILSALDTSSSSSLSDSDNIVPTSKLVAAQLATKANADASNVAGNKAAWKTALGFIEASDLPEQVQVDWTASEGVSSIANKPDVETVASVVTVGDTAKKAVIAGEYTAQVAISSASTTIAVPATATYFELKCVNGGNVTKFEISSNNSYKEVIDGNDVFTISDVSSGSITLSSSVTSGKVQVYAI